ncbi:hypothetical protein GQ53DRAFT_687762 [Thozetella sp. PMI_491]|nr:hypothetical protein GQ53DRAFT_687762 [Thozetella sp. PMI_491]
MKGRKLEVHIEGIIPEIALAGEQGEHSLSFMKFRREALQSPGEEEESEQQADSEGTTDEPRENDSSSDSQLSPSDVDIATARWAWDWIRSHPEIAVNGHKRWNKLKLDQILELPDEPDPEPEPGETTKREDGTEPATVSSATLEEASSPPKNTKSKKNLKTRPRIHASEDLVWRTIAHHSVDYKQIPLKEWQCLLGVASVREKGILQGDLTRLVGQDKRSLPKRTDALASKGYIVKRTTVARKVKTSRIWLADFAPAMVREDANKDVDLSEDSLRADLEPVPWRNRWTGDTVDIESLGRTFLAIVKAWNVIRYTHVKIKMGVIEQRWQMQVLAKLCRRFVDMGILGYTAARLSSSRKIYKDCVKFLREPDREEWDTLLATGKRTSQYSGEGGNREPKPNALALPKKQEDIQDGDDEGDDDDDVPVDVPSRQKLAWTPEKPLITTIFDVIDTTKLTGATNPQVSAAIVGYQFHRFMGNNLTKIAETVQPVHLRHFQVRSEMVRTGKIAGYVFVASKHLGGASSQEGGQYVVMVDAPGPVSDDNPYGFGKVYRRAFAGDEASLTDLGRSAGRHRLAGNPKNFLPKRGRKKHQPEEADEPDIAEEQKDLPRDDPAEENDESIFPDEPSALPDQSAAASSSNSAPEKPRAPEMLPGKPPGAYLGDPGSLNPPRKKQGRPRKSCVVIFKLNQLQDPTFLSSSRPEASVAQCSESTEPLPEEPQPDEQNQQPAEGTEVPGLELRAAPDSIEVSQPSAAAAGGEGASSRGRGRKKKIGGSFRCDTCGNVWKNDLGLKYHLTKSQTPCNPDYDAAAVMEEKHKRKRQRLISPAPATDEQDTHPGAGSYDIAQANDGRTPSAAQPSTPRPSVRKKVRPVKWAVDQSFRGLDVGDVRGARARLAKELADKGIGKAAHHSPMPGKHHQHSRPWPGTEPPRPPRRKPAGDTSSTSRDRTAPPGALNAHPQKDPDSKATAAQSVHEDSFQPEAVASPTTSDEELSSELQPFERTRDYDAISNASARRHAQVSDIINYVLDNSNGVFPGGKSLFFTILRIFLDEFEEETPLTWAFYQKSLKRMEAGKLITTHVHLVRNSQARMVSYSVVVRYGTDPGNSVVAGVKEGVRAAYPKVFIPERFSFADNEVDALEELSEPGKNNHADTPSVHGPSFRMRRAKIEDVEVLDAPYYEQQLETIRDFVESDTAPTSTKRSKRSWVSTDGDNASKRRKRSHAKAASPGRHVSFSLPATQPDDLEDDPDHRISEKRVSGPKLVEPGREDHEMTDLTIEASSQKLSVAQAVKAYGLLPVKGRSRHWTRSRMQRLNKLPANLGRSRNPGLKSLPGTFFTSTGGTSRAPASSAGLEFLEPNTHLGESDQESDAGSRSPSPVVIRRNHGVREQTLRSSGELCFTSFSAIRECAGDEEGLYPALETSFFEKDDKSFVLHGRLPDLQWFFRQRMPKSLDQLLNSTPGPTGKPQAWVDPAYGKFCGIVNRCLRWELNPRGQEELLSGLSLAPDYCFINLPAPRIWTDGETGIPSWREQNQFDLETLPYDELDAFLQDDDGIDYSQPRFRRSSRAQASSDLAKPIARRRSRVVSQNSEKIVQPQVEVEVLKKKRQMTSHPATTDDFIRTPEEDRSEDDWRSEHTRLVAFVVVKTLVGGVGSVIDWGLLMRLFPSQSSAQLRRFWTAARKDRQSTIAHLTDKFRKAFIKAYENNEVPALDFDDVASYDWKFVIEWACNLNDGGDASIQLPSTHKTLDERYVISEREVMDREWRERYVVSTRSVLHRFQDVTSEPMALPIDKNASAPDDDSRMMAVAISWVRSLCVTGEDEYSKEAVAKKLEEVCGLDVEAAEDLLGRAHRHLQAQKIVTKSIVKYTFERRWRLNNRVDAIVEKGAKLDQFMQAMAYKKDLDVAFRTEGKKRVTYITDDGMIMALINLQACGRIRVETTGQPEVALGFEPGNYETRKFPKRYYHFRLDVFPTDEYLYDYDDEMVELRNRIQAAEPPTEGPDGSIPIWCDLFRKVDKERWRQYLGLILFHLASRGSMRAKELAKILKVALMEFEAQLILDWGAKVGIISTPFPGSAPAIQEWWWIAIDALKEAAEAPRPRKKLPGIRHGIVDEDE